MGSPTCPTCYGGVRNRPGNVSTEGTRVRLCDDPWHTTPPTPAPAHVQASHEWHDVPSAGLFVPPAPADDAGVERIIQALGAETGVQRLYGHERMAFVRAVLAAKHPAPDAGAAERAGGEAAVAEHTTRYGPDGDYKVAVSDAEQRTEDAVRELLTIRAALRGTNQGDQPKAGHEAEGREGA